MKNHLRTEVYECIIYLDLDIEGPNRGTKNKQDLMVRVIEYVAEWKEGSYPTWRSMLATRLGLSTRGVCENYLDPLIREHIIDRAGQKVYFNGAPKTDSEEDS